jgi:hypothetical protein
LDVEVKAGRVVSWKVAVPGQAGSGDGKPIAASADQANGVAVALGRQFEFKLPLALLRATPPSSLAVPPAGKARLRFSLWQNRLPVDALPVEGWIELHLLSEDELMALA